MPLPLTMRVRLHLLGMGDDKPGTCGYCGQSYRALLTVALGDGPARDFTRPICAVCLERGVIAEEVIVLGLPEEGPGAHPPTKAMKRRAQKQERQIAEDIGGRAQPASGSLPHAKGDVRVYGEYRVQAKTCRKKGFRLTREILNKARADCGTGEQFTLVLEFLEPGTQKTEEAVAILDYHLWRRLIRAPDDDQ